MRLVLAAAMTLMCIAACPAGASPPRELTAADADALVMAYLGPGKAGWGHDVGAPDDGFYAVTLINPAPGAEGFDLYDVDVHTGDIWRSVTCEHLTNPRSRATQYKLWHRIGLTPSDYRRLRRPGRMCG